MENCNSTLSIHNGTGTTQNDRQNPALMPDFFLLDERKEQDFILFVQKLSKYVNFYNEFDEVDSDWSGFFEKESTSILILIANWNIQLLQNAFENKKNEIALNNGFTTQQKLLKDYFTQIKNEFELLINKTKTLDNEIVVKENLLSSDYAITDKLAFILNQINSSTDITALLKNYIFIKGVQQLFGLLLSWKNFSNSAIEYQLKNYSKHSPHYTLFLSFLKLLDVAQKKLNEFTKKHLDFYYKDVLHIQNQEAKPDYVHLVIEPYDLNPFLISEGTIFPADKNSSGQKKFYASTADQTINGIKLHSFLSVHFKNNSYYKSDLLSLNAMNEGFDVFTSKAQLFKEGLMIASPNLYLQSGERIIKLRFNDTKFNADNFDFYITGEEKIIEITDKENFKENSKLELNQNSEASFNAKFRADFNEDIKERAKLSVEYIKLTIPATEKKIVPFNKKLHPDFLVQTSFPVLKIVPKKINVLNSIYKIELNISVTKFKSFVLDSDFGRIDTEKAFYPFGEFPKNGNGIIISSNEFFMKKNARARIQMLAEEGSSKNYFVNRTKTFILDDGAYSEYKTKGDIPNIHPLIKFNFEEVAGNEIVSNGKIRIELNSSGFEGETFMLNYIKASGAKTDLPYKPRAKEFIFDYSVNEAINLANRKNDNDLTELYHSLPFGYKKLRNEILRFTQNKSLEGSVYLGFQNVEPKDGLNLLLQLEEGTANPLLEPATISWNYLSQNIWTQIESNALGDETLSLTQSGLVSITVPEFNSILNTELESNLFWLKISVSNIQAVCKFIGVHTQALKAVLTDYENSGVVFTENTPKETITKSYNSLNQVKKITQPYSSFGGKVTEKDEFLYQRVSERLRHKNRAITTWDYERIILQEFPEVYRVKSLNHYRYDTKISNVSAGYVTLILIARSSNTDIINWKPLLSLNKMLLIKEHLTKIASPHTRISVKPPKLEKVEIQFNVKFHNTEGMDSRLYINELIKTINNYLSPWAYETSDVNFANEIEFSSIIQLIDNQSFVDYITDFKVTQYFLDANNQVSGSPIQNLNKISPQTDYTLFVPNESHKIKEI